MNTGNRRLTALLLSALLVSTLSGCAQDGQEKETVLSAEAADTSEHASVSTVALTEGKYSEEKLDDTWDEKEAVYLSLENDKISFGENAGLSKDSDDEDKVEITEGTAVIKGAGTYVLSGTLKDGQIIVDGKKEDTVRLIFNGVSLTSSSSAPVYSKGGNLIVTLAEGTVNTIEDGGDYTLEVGEDEPGAAVFAKDDLTFNGTGSLHVTGNYNHGIQCKEDLKFVSGTYVISAANDGIVGKDSVSVRDGCYTIESGDDGIKATNAEASDKGYILIENGSFQIAALGDGLQAETLLRVNDGDFEITAGGGCENAEMVSGMPEEIGGMTLSGNGQGMREGRMTPPEGEMPEEGMTPPEGEMPEGGMTPPEGEMPQGEIPKGGMTPPQGETPKGDESKADENDTLDASSEAASTKALKSYVELILAGGEFNLNSQDDGIHSNQNVTILDGFITISTGDDGIHAEKTLTVENGSIDIQKSYEGLEGFDIVINGGDIKVVSSDDGINAAGEEENAEEPEKPKVSQAEEKENAASDGGRGGGHHFMADEDQGASMTINGGTVYVNANGDGLDANGDIFIGGGEVTVHGPADGGNGTLDYAASCKITGGTLIGIGSMGMAQNPSGDSTQASLVFQTDKAVEAGTPISLKDKEGNILAETVTEKTAQWFAISSPSLSVGESYIFCAGTAEKEVNLTQTVSQFSF